MDPAPPTIYLDNHSTTRCADEVAQAMWPWFTTHYGNASSRTHSFGREARQAVEAARAQLGALLSASPKELIFTSGATESINLAWQGLAKGSRDRGRHFVTVATEHRATLDVAQALVNDGAEVTVLPVGPGGLVDPQVFAGALRVDTVMASVMLANNEIGVIQPIPALAAAARERGVLLHVDAAQALGKVPVDVRTLGADLLSFTAHKMHGPQGIGGLWIRRGRPSITLDPIAFGGGHERGLRSGTLPVALIVGLGAAAALAVQDLADGTVEATRQRRDRLWHGLSQALPDVELVGDPLARLPHNLSVLFRGVEAEALLMGVRELALSTGSACSSETLTPSHVLRAVLPDPEAPRQVVRVGLSRYTTDEEVERAVTVLVAKVQELRQLGGIL